MTFYKISFNKFDPPNKYGHQGALLIMVRQTLRISKITYMYHKDFLFLSGIWEDIQCNREAAFERKDSGSMVLTDITDGAAYRMMMGDGLFLDKTKHNLTAIFNTDGVNLYSSSKIELWPIFLAINELSPT